MANNNDMSSLAMMSLKEIPQANADAQRIVGLVKKSGRVTGYKLENGQMISKDESLQIARQGGIQGVGIASRNGNEYLKSIPDGSDDNNLSDLPTVR